MIFLEKLAGPYMGLIYNKRAKHFHLNSLCT